MMIIYTKMRISFKNMVISLLIVLTVFILIRIAQQTTPSPAGLYVSSINCKDTLKLYPSGRFEQVVYNEKNILVYSCISKWSKTTMGIRIDSILLYDDIKYLNHWKEYPVEGGMYTGLNLENRNNRYVLSWRYYVDIPEKSINYIRIKEMK